MGAYKWQRGYGHHVYLRPSQKGRGLGGILRGIFRMLKPIVKTGVKTGIRMAKPALKKIGKRAIKEGGMMMTDVGKDMIDGKNIKSSIKNQGLMTVNRMIKKPKQKKKRKIKREFI